MLGAEGTASSDGYVAGYGTGADGSGFGSSNAVKRLAGVTSRNRNVNSVTGPYVVRLPKAIAMFASRACRVSTYTELFSFMTVFDIPLLLVVFAQMV